MNKGEIEGRERKKKRLQNGDFTDSEKSGHKKIAKTMSNMVWLNNGTRNTRVKKEMMSEYIDNGWVVGRLPFKHKKEK